MAADSSLLPSGGEIIQFLRDSAEHANFPSGIVLGIGMAGLANHLADRGAQKERARRLELDMEREKELRSQLDRKEERLLALHKELEKVRESRKK